jgi:hypothetical protein
MARRICTLAFCLSGTTFGLLVAGYITMAAAQCLVDSDDDAVVIWAVNYFKWAGGAIMLAGGTAGTVAGWAMSRDVRWDDRRLNRVLNGGGPATCSVTDSDGVFS